MADPDDFPDSPLQAEVRAALRIGEVAQAPSPSIGNQLRELIIDRLGDAKSTILARPAGSPLVVDRVKLTDVNACEAFFVHGSEPFEYDVKKARGQIAFTTIRRRYFQDRQLDPITVDIPQAVHEVIDEAAIEPGSLGEFLSRLTPSERAELVAEAVNVVYAFFEAWPTGLSPKPIRTHWRLKANLLDRKLQLTHRVSFRFGQPRRDRGLLFAAVTLLDIRPGRQYEEEERANRFYASLLETLSVNVPPVRAATWYAESQEICVDSIATDHLEAAARRAGDGVRRIVELHEEGRSPDRQPGWRCDYCRLFGDCAIGQAFVGRNA